MSRIIIYCEAQRVTPQLICEENSESHYEEFDIERFSFGMTNHSARCNIPTFL